MSKGICTVADCGRPQLGREWCSTHYQRWLRHGDPLQINTNRGLTVEQCWESHVDRSSSSGCWLWTGALNVGGYGMFGDRAAGTWRRTPAHRYGLEAALGRPLGPGMYTLHSCDNPACVRNDDSGWYEIRGVLRPLRGHLWEGTLQENVWDRADKGRNAVGASSGRYTRPERNACGEGHGRAKLTEARVLEIRARYAAGGVTQAELAAEFGVVLTAINKVVRRKAWAHI